MNREILFRAKRIDDGVRVVEVREEPTKQTSLWKGDKT